MSYYYDVTIHYNIVDNTCYNTIEESFDTLEEAVNFAKKHWTKPFEVGQLIFSDIGDVVSDVIDHDDGRSWDLLTITKMKEL